MSAVLKDRPALDRDGMHWEAHGEVMLMDRSPSLDKAAVFVGVHSQRHPRRCDGQAHVVLQCGHGAFSFAGMLSSRGARELAAKLLAAAERTEQVALSLVGGA